MKSRDLGKEWLAQQNSMIDKAYQRGYNEAMSHVLDAALKLDVSGVQALLGSSIKEPEK